MDKKKCLVDFLNENDNVTIIADSQTIINVLFEYASNTCSLSVGRYEEEEPYLMISKLYNELIVESIIGYQGEVYYMDSNKIIITTDALNFVIDMESLDRIIDECEEFQVI